MPLVTPPSMEGPGLQINLGLNDDLLIAENVTVVSTNGNAVFAEDAAHVITVAGSLDAHRNAITIAAAPGSSGFVLTISDTGQVTADDVAVVLSNTAFDLTNDGTITSVWGISATEVSTASVITNTGTLTTERAAIMLSGDGQIRLENSGTIDAGSTAYDHSAGAGTDLIRNTGLIRGGINLGGGNDVYDGRGGQITGVVFAGLGDDRFAPGQGVETLQGSEGRDVLDFRAGGGLRVALDGSLAGTGAAAGDTYTGIEDVLGSAQGDDTLRGDDQANRLAGNGGEDRLSGAGGADVLTGGAGRDTLTGGTGADVFLFNAPGQGGDRISDFGNVDRIGISRAGFDLGGTGDDLPAGRFHSGRTNQAQDANDRFIFRTGDETLWFDRDGKGGAGPVLIADLQDGARMTAADIFLLA